MNQRSIGDRIYDVAIAIALLATLGVVAFRFLLTLRGA